MFQTHTQVTLTQRGTKADWVMKVWDGLCGALDSRKQVGKSRAWYRPFSTAGNRPQYTNLGKNSTTKVVENAIGQKPAHTKIKVSSYNVLYFIQFTAKNVQTCTAFIDAHSFLLSFGCNIVTLSPSA